MAQQLAGVAHPPKSGVQTPPEFASQSGQMRNGIIGLTAFFVVAAVVLLAMPGLGSVLRRIESAQPGWIAAALILEVLSCIGYVVVFLLLFGELDRRIAIRLGFAEQAANSIVSAAGAGGLALGAWVLRRRGVARDRIARSSVAMFLLTGAVNVGAVAVIGPLMGAGLLSGSRQALLTFLPAAAALAMILAGVAAGALPARVAPGEESRHPRGAALLSSLADGLDEALILLRSGDWRLLGAVGYWLFDTLVLYACFRAFGDDPALSAVAMAYLLGLLANSLPVPGGFAVIDGGLVGALLLYGVHPASLDLAAVLAYRGISAWIPSAAGLLAFASLRRDILRAGPAPSAAE